MSLLKNRLCVHNTIIHSHYPDVSRWLLFNYHDLQHSHTSPLSQNLITAAPVVAAAEWGMSLRWMVVIFTSKGPLRMKDWLTDVWGSEEWGLHISSQPKNIPVSVMYTPGLGFMVNWPTEIKVVWRHPLIYRKVIFGHGSAFSCQIQSKNTPQKGTRTHTHTDVPTCINVMIYV